MAEDTQILEEEKKEQKDFTRHEKRKARKKKAILKKEAEKTPFRASLVSNSQVEPQDVHKKRTDALDLLESAVEFLRENDVLTVAQAFSLSEEWRKGELYVALFNVERDRCLANGDDVNFIWEPVKAIYSEALKPDTVLKQFQDGAAEEKPVYLQLKNKVKEIHVKSLVKGENTYILAVGFFPFSADFFAYEVVRSTAEALEYAHSSPIGDINNPYGPYVRGDIFPSVYTLEGECIAHGSSRAIINKNRINTVDSKGEPIFKEIFNKIKSGVTEGHILAEWNNSPIKILYKSVESHWSPLTRYEKIDPLVVIAYYNLEEGGKRDLRNFLAEAVKHFEVYGLEKACSDYSNKQGKFCFAGMHIEVYDQAGKCLANGESPELVNANLLNQKDFYGNYQIRSLLEDTQAGTHSFRSILYKGANKVYYARSIKTDADTYVIAASYYVFSKTVEIPLFVKAAINHLKHNPLEKVCFEFGDPKGAFFTGDVFITMCRENGTCIVGGYSNELIWRNFNEIKDEKGTSLFPRILEQAIAGGGWSTFSYNNGKRCVYSQSADVAIGDAGEKERIILFTEYYV
jgi:hypothetical protein